MKIVFIITGLSSGGAEEMLFKLLQTLDRNRFDPYVISLTTSGKYGSRIKTLNVPVSILGIIPAYPNPLKFFRLLRWLYQIKPDVVHTWMYHADLLGGIAARMAGVRAVAWSLRQSNLSRQLNGRSTLFVIKLCALLSHWLPLRILTCSERARVTHVAAGYDADKITLIPNGFDLIRFHQDKASRDLVFSTLKLPPGSFLIGLIARSDPQKNHSGFIEAAIKINQAVPQAHFLLAGTGIDQHNDCLVQSIAKGHLLDCFHLLGQREDIPQLMAALDVLVSPSHGEAFPNVLGEAMACGVPCVVTDVGDSAEIVGDTGWVVPSGDMFNLAQQVITLLALPLEQRHHLGKRARQRVLDRYEISNITKRYQEFYVRLLSES